MCTDGGDNPTMSEGVVIVRSLAACAVLGLAFRFAIADDWPQGGRDATRNAVSREKNPPTFWQVEERDATNQIVRAAKNVRWSATGNFGHATHGEPVVSGGLVWVSTTADVPSANGFFTEKRPAMACFDERTGTSLYRFVGQNKVALGNEYPLNGMNCAPLVEGNRLWFLSAQYKVVCLDIQPLLDRAGEPKELWVRDLIAEHGVHPRGFDFVSLRRCSIVSHGERIYVATGHGRPFDRKKPPPEGPSLLCLDKRTGKTLWKDALPAKDIIHMQTSSPTIVVVDGKAQVVIGQGDGWARAFDAVDGTLLWRCDLNAIADPPYTFPDSGRNRRNYVMASPVFAEGRIYLGTGQEGEHEIGQAWLTCICPSRRGNVSAELPTDVPLQGKPNPNSAVVWRVGGPREKGKPYAFSRTISNVVVANGLVFAPTIGGWVHCFDAATGKEHWRHDVESNIVGNPVLVDGLVYIGDNNGVVWVFKAATKREVVAQIEMHGQIRYTPTFANGTLYVADSTKLYAIRAE